jgi:hypothetical protein
VECDFRGEMGDREMQCWRKRAVTVRYEKRIDRFFGKAHPGGCPSGSPPVEWLFVSDKMKKIMAYDF